MLDRAKVQAALSGLWHGLRDDASTIRLAYVTGAIGVLEIIDALNHVEADGWRARIQRCPGHDDEGGRSWCAYCGDIRARLLGLGEGG